MIGDVDYSDKSVCWYVVRFENISMFFSKEEDMGRDMNSVWCCNFVVFLLDIFDDHYNSILTKRLGLTNTVHWVLMIAFFVEHIDEI